MRSLDEIALHIVGGLPRSISHRVIANTEWQHSVGLNGLVGVIDEAGRSRLGDLLDAARSVYRTGRAATFVNLDQEETRLCLNGDVVQIYSDADQKTEKPTLTPGLALVSPDPNVRLDVLEFANKAFGATGPSDERWRAILDKRPLTNDEVSEFYDEMSSSVPNWWRLAEEAISNNRANLADLVPVSPEYWTTLVGPLPNTLAASEYCAGPLQLHRSRLLANDPDDALSLLLPGCLDRATDIEPQMLSSISERLFALCDANKSVSDPISLVGLAALTAKLGRQDSRFDSLTSQLVTRLSDDQLPRHDGVDTWEIFPAIVRMCLAQVRKVDGFLAQPPYWLWLCAFSHAGLLTRLLENFTINPSSISNWAKNFYDDWNLTADCIALHVEPAWRFDCLERNSLRGELAGRLAGILEAEIEARNEVPFDDLIETVLAGSFKKGVWPFLPGPLEGHLRVSARKNRSALEGELEETFRTKLSNREAGTWSATLVISQVHSLSEQHIALIEQSLRDTVEVAEHPDECFEALYFVSVIAALLELPPLAETVVSLVPMSIATEGDAKSAFLTIIAASSAIDERTRVDWVSEQLLTLSHREMSSAVALYLGRLINSLVCFFPNKNWRFGRASAACFARAYEPPRTPSDLEIEDNNSSS